MKALVRNSTVGYFVTTRMGATRIGFSRPAGFDLGLRNSGVHISGPEFEISRPECLCAPQRSDPRRSGTPGLRNSGVHISGPKLEISRPEFRFAP